MEIEKKKKQGIKRRERANSDDPSDCVIFFKRVKKTIRDYLNFQLSSPSTQFFQRPFNPEINVDFKIQEPCVAMLQKCQSSYKDIKNKDLKATLNTLIEACNLIMGKEKHTKNKITKKESLKDQKKWILEEQFQDGVTDFKALAELTGFNQQQVRNLWIKFTSNRSIFQDYRNQRNKLNEEHCKFILEFFSKSENIDKTISELHSELKIHFNFDDKQVRFLLDFIYICSFTFFIA